MHYDINYAVAYNASQNSYTLEGGSLKFAVAGRDIISVSQNNDQETQNFTLVQQIKARCII